MFEDFKPANQRSIPEVHYPESRHWYYYLHHRAVYAYVFCISMVVCIYVLCCGRSMPEK